MKTTACFVLCTFFPFAVPLAQAGIIYVKADAAGLTNGTSWSNAFTTLQPAIDSATNSDQVWIAEGKYIPTSWPNGGSIFDERLKHFSLKNGVSVYGGFAGTETNLADRDPSAHPTILSGDLNGDDSVYNNSVHVFFHDLPYVRLDNTAILDGVTIKDGNSATYFGLSPHQSGAAFYNDHSSPLVVNCLILSNATATGGAIYNSYSSPILTNCIIAHNLAGNDGGAIYNYQSSPTNIDCVLENNQATARDGGAIYNSGTGSWPRFLRCRVANNRAARVGGFGGGICNVSGSRPYILGCVIVSNSAGAGGGIQNTASDPYISWSTIAHNSATNFGTGGGIGNSGGAAPSIRNCTIAGNMAQKGGGIYDDHTALSMLNCTVVDNSAYQGGGIYHDGSASPFPSIINCTIASNSATNGGGVLTDENLRIANSILWDNLPSEQIAVSYTYPAVEWCIIQNGFPFGYSTYGILTNDALLLPLGDHGGPTQTRPISIGSPAIDAAFGFGAPSADQRYFPTNSTRDIGACEFHSLYVLRSGTNPAPIGAQVAFTAFTDLTDAHFQWFIGGSGDESHPLGAESNDAFTTASLELGTEFWIRLNTDSTNHFSETQLVSVRGMYPEWVAFHGLAGPEAEPGASPAGDSVANLIKFASGLDPHTAFTAADYSTFTSDPASNTVSMTWTQSKTPTDINWAFRQSHDLAAWSPPAVTPISTESSAAFEVWSITMPIETNRLFLDVEISRVVP